MIDLVKRLREGAAGDIALCRTAADEIERQREALRIGQAALETALNQLRDTQAQVVALRAALAEYGETDSEIMLDTAAVARETERRLRIEGAEAMNEAWQDANCRTSEPPPPVAVVDAMTPKETP